MSRPGWEDEPVWDDQTASHLIDAVDHPLRVFPAEGDEFVFVVEGHAIRVLQLECPYPSHRVGIKIEGWRDKEGCATVVEDQGVTSNEGAVRNAPDVHAFVSQRYSFQDLKMSVQNGFSAFFIGKSGMGWVQIHLYSINLSFCLRPYNRGDLKT